MRTEVFKTRAEFEEWEAKKGNCIYCLFDYVGDKTEGKYLCDLIEEDFIELVDAGLVNPNGYYCLLKPLTDKQKELLKENHGIRIIILEEDFALSDEQKEAIKDFENVWRGLKEKDLKLIMDLDCDKICAVSTKITKDVLSVWGGDLSDDDIIINDASHALNLDFVTIQGFDDNLVCTLK